MSKNILFAENLEDSQMAELSDRFEELNHDYSVLEGDLAEYSGNVDVFIVKNMQVDPDYLANELKPDTVIVMRPGETNLSEDLLGETDVTVKTIVNPGQEGVAEHTILLMLSLVKKLPEVARITKEGDYPQEIEPKLTTQEDYTFNWSGVSGMDVLYYRTLGLIGMGTIGTMVAKRAKSFEMDVLYYDVNMLPEKKEKELGIEYVSLEDLLGRSDFVSLHVRVTEQTEKMINEETLAKMKNSAYLINTARGRLVDEDDLYNALKGGVIAGAGLDVFWMEPPERDNQLLGLDNVILTSHCAGIYLEDAYEMEVEFILDIIGSRS